MRQGGQHSAHPARLPMSGLSQAIPPAYTEFIGGQLYELVSGSTFNRTETQ